MTRGPSPKLVLPIAALVAGLLLLTIALLRADAPGPSPVAEPEPEPERPVPAPSAPEIRALPVAPERRSEISVASTPPGAQVRWDGEARGVTPLTFEVPADEAPHRLELRREGSAPESLDARADADQHFELSLRPLDLRALEARRDPARITVVSRPPGAQVLWDGEPVGKTPLVFRRPRDGEPHALVVEAEGGVRERREVLTSSDVIERFELPAGR